MVADKNNISLFFLRIMLVPDQQPLWPEQSAERVQPPLYAFLLAITCLAGITICPFSYAKYTF